MLARLFHRHRWFHQECTTLPSQDVTRAALDAGEPFLAEHEAYDICLGCREVRNLKRGTRLLNY